jgi:hypothetical protein
MVLDLQRSNRVLRQSREVIMVLDLQRNKYTCPRLTAQQLSAQAEQRGKSGPRLIVQQLSTQAEQNDCTLGNCINCHCLSKTTDIIFTVCVLWLIDWTCSLFRLFCSKDVNYCYYK